jgi:hypothetical protein
MLEQAAIAVKLGRAAWIITWESRQQPFIICAGVWRLRVDDFSSGTGRNFATIRKRTSMFAMSCLSTLMSVVA